MNGYLAALLSFIGAFLAALLILALRALWSLATQLASLRSATEGNTRAITDLSRRVDLIDRRRPRRPAE